MRWPSPIREVLGDIETSLKQLSNLIRTRLVQLLEFLRSLVQGFWNFERALGILLWRYKTPFLVVLTVVYTVALLYLYPIPSRYTCYFSKYDDGRWDNSVATGHTNLGQCWNEQDQEEFYSTSQGSHIIQWDVIRNLENPTRPNVKQGGLLWSLENFRRWGFLELKGKELQPVQAIDPSIEEWPVGFALDVVNEGLWKRTWLGPTCSACHTGQVEYKDQNGKEWRIRVDGGPSMIDVGTFMTDLKDSLLETVNDKDKFDRYLTRSCGHKTHDRDLVWAQLDAIAADREAWHRWNIPMGRDPKGRNKHYPAGFGRLDAFGVIFNTVADYLGATVTTAKLADAPVSYPTLWDTSKHDWIQWNASIGPHTIGRNVGQAIGVFAHINHLPVVTSPPTSIRIDNQIRLQKLVSKLRSPRWPRDLWPITKDQDSLAKYGETIYRKQCMDCHALQPRDKGLDKIAVGVVPIKAHYEGRSNTVGLVPLDYIYTGKGKTYVPLGTDDRVATNIAGRRATSGEVLVLKHYVEAIEHNLTHFPSQRWSTIVAIVEKLQNFFSWWRWDWNPDEHMVYKARPLDGIWATAPYLHNGSVRTLQQLLLPASQREEGFCMGSRQFDPIEVGFVSPYNNPKSCEDNGLYWLDTKRAVEEDNRPGGVKKDGGNRRDGHDYPLCPEEDGECTQVRAREALLEYLKTL